MNKLSLGAIALIAVTSGVAIAPQVKAVNLTGLTNTVSGPVLVNFDTESTTPSNSVPLRGIPSTSVPLTGVLGNLLGIDYRPADGQLYGVASSNNIYTINPSTGVATFVSTLDVPLSVGGSLGVNFNPVVDRLRVVGINDTNYRINVDTGETLVDGTLAYATGDANFGVNPNIATAAYTNSFLGAPSPAGVTPPTRTTQLYNIDSTLDILTLQSPANNGTLTTIGSLGIDFDRFGTFDIFTDDSGANTAFAVSQDSTRPIAILYTIDLSTGAANSLGIVGSRSFTGGLAAKPVPEPSSVIGSVAAVTLGGVAVMRRRRRQITKF